MLTNPMQVQRIMLIYEHIDKTCRYNIYAGCVNFQCRGYVLNIRPRCELIFSYQMCDIFYVLHV